MNKSAEMSLNPLVQFLKKSPKEVTKADIINYIEAKGIEMLDFRYVAADGRLKALNFVISDRAYLEQILSSGERVEGARIFPAFVSKGSSNLYVVPRFSTAFIDPFKEIPTISFLCSYFDKNGEQMKNSPEYILQKAVQSFRTVTGMDFQAMGELEYYVIGESEDLFPTADQRGYHESTPFAKFEQFRCQCMHYIAQTGGLVKYGHSDTGNFTFNGKIYEQNEIEFCVADVQDAADQLIIAKWIIRSLAYVYGLEVTFASKMTNAAVGSGMHVHTRIVKNGVNQYVTDKQLNDTARKTIAGYITCASALTAFGNTNPASYIRLASQQKISWSDTYRSVPVRVPLGWTSAHDMVAAVNPLEKPTETDFSQLQTIEFRCPDGSADIYLLMAGLVIAARHGFEMPNALEIAANTYVDENINNAENKEKRENLAQLPDSCWASAEALNQHRAIFEKYGVFESDMIDAVVNSLKSFNDKNIHKELKENPNKMMELVKQYYHCG